MRIKKHCFCKDGVATPSYFCCVGVMGSQWFAKPSVRNGLQVRFLHTAFNRGQRPLNNAERLSHLKVHSSVVEHITNMSHRFNSCCTCSQAFILRFKASFCLGKEIFTSAIKVKIQRADKATQASVKERKRFINVINFRNQEIHRRRHEF